MRVIVVGAGIIGLSCALRLAERRHQVTVVAADDPADTTSTVAGGLIYPRHAKPEQRCWDWTQVSFAEFQRFAPPLVNMPRYLRWLAGAVAEAGVRFERRAVDVLPTAVPAWYSAYLVIGPRRSRWPAARPRVRASRPCAPCP